VPIQSPNENKVYAASLVFNHEGVCVAQYNKLHLFDVSLPDKKESYRESDTFLAGDQVVVIDSPFGKLGLTICYDLRFPELYRELARRGAEIIVVPSAFTLSTGRAHWELLCRARAVENSCYLIAANQCGEHANGRKTYGHSMVVDPWGVVLEVAADKPSVVMASIHNSSLEGVRSSFPALKHSRFSYHLTRQ
jgi:nitrilase